MERRISGINIVHVVIVNDFASVSGGAAQVAFAGARGLAERGHRVTFFAAVGPVDAALAKHTNITVHCLEQEDILRDPQRMRALWRGIWNSKAGVVFDELLGY